MKNVSFYTMATVGGKNNKKYDIYYVMFILICKSINILITNRNKKYMLSEVTNWGRFKHFYLNGCVSFFKDWISPKSTSLSGNTLAIINSPKKLILYNIPWVSTLYNKELE